MRKYLAMISLLGVLTVSNNVNAGQLEKTCQNILDTEKPISIMPDRHVYQSVRAGETFYIINRKPFKKLDLGDSYGVYSNNDLNKINLKGTILESQQNF